MRKIFSVLFALVLVVSLTLVTAVPVASGDIAAGVIFVGDSLAAWSTEKYHSGAYSVKLKTGLPDWYYWAGLQIPYGNLLSTFITTGTGENAVLDVSQTNFFYHMESGKTGQVPIMALVFKEPVLGETWKLILAPESATTETGLGDWKNLQDAFTFTTGHLWKLTGAGTSEDWKADNTWGAPPLFEELGWWQNNVASPIKDKAVDYVEVSIGTQAAIVYIDDVMINGVTFDLEPATGALGMTASYVAGPLPQIGISVSPGSVTFGSVVPGVSSPSSPATVTVTNTGTVAAKFTASIAAELPPGVYTNGLKISGTAVSAWSAPSVAATTNVTPGLILTVPPGTAPGTYTATLIFWAEAATLP